MSRTSVLASLQRSVQLWLACFRFILILLLVLIGTCVVVLVAPIPGTYKGSPLCAWIATYMSRIALFIANIELDSFDRQRIYNHQGFIFGNHQSYLDVIILFSIRPARYLAKLEIGDMPIAKTLARRVGTIFVKRESRESRAESRRKLAKLDSTPPIVIFPEGVILTEFALQPFRHGAFRLAVETGYPYLPIIFLYNPSGVARWMEDSILLDFWYMLLDGPIKARVITLPTVYPKPSDDPVELADAMWQTAYALYTPTMPKEPVYPRSG